jgi:methylmalonyl-CoA/ethylmalonyl-CoA epimerase
LRSQAEAHCQPAAEPTADHKGSDYSQARAYEDAAPEDRVVSARPDLADQKGEQQGAARDDDGARRCDMPRPHATSLIRAGQAAQVIGRLNHVGVATPSIDESLRFYRETLGVAAVSDKRALPEQGVSVAFVTLPNTEIELIEPLGEQSTLHGFLAKNPRGGPAPPLLRGGRDPRGAGRAAGQGAAGAGARESPASAPMARPYCSSTPRTTDGLLIEIMETHHGEARAAAPGLGGTDAARALHPDRDLPDALVDDAVRGAAAWARGAITRPGRTSRRATSPVRPVTLNLKRKAPDHHLGSAPLSGWCW